MKYRLIMVFLFIIVILPIVHSQEINKQDALTWIKNNVNNNGQIEELAFAILALDKNNIDIPTISEALIQRKNPNNCYPEDVCSSKDTSLAALALDHLRKNTTDILSWVKSTEQIAGGDIDWLIQIKTTKTGECKITHEGTETTITIDEEGLVQPYNSNWINIVSDLDISIDKPLETINVDCNDLNDFGMIISLIRRDLGPPLKFFIIRQVKQKSAGLSVQNGCFAPSPGESCDVDTTFYTSWVLDKLGEKVNTITYMDNNLDTNLHRAMLASISGKNKDLNNLAENQQVEGSWDDSTLTTAFAIDALKQKSTYKKLRDNATNWMVSEQQTEGSQKGSLGTVKESAIAMYLVFSQVSTLHGDGEESTPEFCGDDFKNSPNDEGFFEECDGNDDDQCPNQCNDDCTCPGITDIVDTCSKDSDCNPPNEFCDKIGEVCKKRDTCITNVDCIAGYECVNNLCYIRGEPICGDGKIEGAEECESRTDCHGNERCDATCECIIPEDVRPKETPFCGNGIIEKTEECESSTDCSGNDLCDSFSCKCISPENKGEERGFPTGILIGFIIIAILGLVGYLVYTKVLKKPPGAEPGFLGPQKPEEPPQQKVYSPSAKPGDETLEKELDRSIDEAKNLLKKK